MDVVRRVREQRARQQTAKASMAETEAAAAQREEVIENITAFLEADETLTVELSELNRTKGRHPRGSVQAEETRNLVDQKTDDQKVIRQELGAIKASNQSAYDEGTRRYNFRQEALEMAESNRQLIGSATVADIRSRLAGAVEAGFIVTSANKDEATVSFDRQSYGSAWPHDPSVSDVTASLRELIDDLSSRREEGDAVITAELHRGGFYISARRDPDGKGGQLPSELDLLRDEGVARKASEFLAGKGQRYVARTGRGFTVLENRNGKFVAVKTSDPRTGRALFTVPDRESGGRVARKSTPEIANSGTTVTATDVSGVWYDPLRLALEEDLRREAESAERREAADELRDISSLETPLSLGDIATGSTGTAPVSISYEDPESRRRNTVTFQVTGNGTTFSVTGTVPGTEETIKRVKRDPRTRKVVSSKPFLPEFVGKETPLGVLEKDPLWRLVRDLNRPYERDWRLTREAERLNAVPVTRENFEGLLDLEGQNGVYAVKATLRKNIAKPGQERHFVYNPVGYIMERNGSKVKIVWAVPGTSANYAEGMIGNEYEVADLPNRLRFVLGNVDWTFTKTNNRPHLQPVKRQEAETGADNTEE
ncbi:MAG: hypothetical protein HY505_01715 [Candidatus Yanofskybacteria bacterium]|nr:hypothetical protein [Candidatus Yanofskybacteria bacterium]